MSNKIVDKTRLENSDSRRTSRRYLPPLLRYSIIASWGSVLGVFVFYLLKKIGY